MELEAEGEAEDADRVRRAEDCGEERVVEA